MCANVNIGVLQYLMRIFEKGVFASAILLKSYKCAE